MRSHWLVGRVLMVVPMVLATVVLSFLIIHLVPGDPVRTMLGLHATPENIAATRAQMGLDRPMSEQFAGWLSSLTQADLGEDFISHRPVADLVAERLPVTLELTVLSMVLGVVGGVGLGLVTAGRSAGVSRVGEAASMIGISIPYFWLGILLSLIIGGYLRLLPPSGYVPFAEDPLAHVQYMVLPTLTLAMGQAAYLSRITRALVTDLLRGPSVVFLTAKGMSRGRIVFRHLLRQASAPLMTIIGIEMGVLLGGSIIVESIFGLPGIGSLVVTAVQQRNYPVVQGSVLVISVLVIVVTVVTDIAVRILDPRVARGGSR